MNDNNRKGYEDDLFGPVIFSYTDKQAVEDGVLVDVSRLTKGGVNRITASVYAFLEGQRFPQQSAATLLFEAPSNEVNNI